MQDEIAGALKRRLDELLSWTECFEKADVGTRRLIFSRFIERVEVSTGYKVRIKFRILLKRFLGQEYPDRGSFLQDYQDT